MDKLKILVLGDGLLGSELVKQTGWDFISRKKDQLDINNFISFIPKTDQFKPIHNVIINCIANTNTYSTDKDSHWITNYVFVSNLVDYCNTFGIKLIHISTDYVYAGSNTNASEEDVPVHSNNWYSYTKLLADGYIQLRCNDFLICRCTHKPTPFPYDNAWIDQIGNFDYVNIIADLIIKLINSDASGMYNVGTETKTIYELAKKTRDVKKSFSPIHVPKNQSMNLNKLWNTKI